MTASAFYLRYPYAVDDREGYVETVSEDESIVSLLVCVDDDPVGEVVFRPTSRDNGRAEIGIWLVPRCGTAATPPKRRES